ncbi:rhodanese-like domain-containing protein [Embleya sp. NPDC056575]|uniref:MBL fold metallo-hydrolase n=1 Tax=unclassified Embleya TaxID=2699296 RepID=UPI0036B45383
MRRIDRMFFKQYYLDCLSHASYLIGDRGTGRAVVVDPRRDVAEYLADAERNGLTIERVIETHVHADFLSGHLELAARTGARISYGSPVSVEFEVDSLDDGRRISLGDVELEVLHTPGHTPESICVVVRAAAGDSVPFGVLTGDTLFIGDVGRPDLLGAHGWSATDLARALFRSTRRLLALPDPTRVYPAHGAGSACGKNLSSKTSCTIGEQRGSNYALAPLTEDEFVRAVCAGQSAAPIYFAKVSARNREHRPLLDETEPVPRLATADFLSARAAGCVVLDTRDPDDFADAHVVGSLNVALSGRFAGLVGQILDADVPLLLVTAPGTEIEARNRLARIGFDNVVAGLAASATEMPERELAGAPRLTPEEIAALGPKTRLVDVRDLGEIREHGTIAGSKHIALQQLLARIEELSPTQDTVVFCAGGTRSSVAASTLRARGFTRVSDLRGGFAAWQARYPSDRPGPS